MIVRTQLSQRARWAGAEPIASLLMARALSQPKLISLAAGFVDHQTLPVEATRLALERIWSDSALARAALQYGTTIGHGPLREALLERMLRADGKTAAEINVDAQNIVITAGSNQLLFLLADVLLDPGDIVLCAAPSYYVFLGTLANLGARAVGIEADDNGVSPEAVEEELRRRQAAGELDRVKAIYLTSYYDNPSAVTLSADRRAALVDVAKRWSRATGRIYVIEDAAYRELRFAGDDTPSLRAFDAEGDTVIHAGTFSKSFSPGIRVGWGVAPSVLMRPLLAEKGNFDFGSPNFNQILMTAMLENSSYDAHLERLRAGYREKVKAIVGAADEFLAPIGGIEWIPPSGGLYLWLRLPEEIDTGLAGRLFTRALAEGMLYVPGEYCYPLEGRKRPKNMLRLSFGVQSVEGLRRGVQALAQAIRQVL